MVLGKFSRLVLRLVAGLAASLPSVEPNSPGVFAWPVIDNPSAVRDGHAAYAAAHIKWGADLPDDLANHVAMKAMTATENGTMNITSITSDISFISLLGIGTPPQMIPLVVDTGSADCWTEDATAAYGSASAGHATGYNASESSTAKEVDGAKWIVQYADDSYASGKVFNDTLHLGHGFTVENMAIQEALIISQDFQSNNNYSGIVGLAKQLPSKVSPPMPSLMDHLKETMAEPYITVDLRSNATGQVEFGEINSSFANKLSWVESDPNSPHWDFQLTRFRWTTMENGTWWRNDVWGTADTGTTLLLLPGAIVDMYWQNVSKARQEQSSWVFPCSTSPGDLPDFEFMLDNGYTGTVPGHFLNYGPVTYDATACYGGLQSSDSFGTSIVGAMLLKTQFVAFDVDRHRIGFAPKDIR